MFPWCDSRSTLGLHFYHDYQDCQDYQQHEPRLIWMYQVFIVESSNEFLSSFQGNHHDIFKFEKVYFSSQILTKILWFSSGGWLIYPNLPRKAETKHEK